jgi:hypothetical protein
MFMSNNSSSWVSFLFFLYLMVQFFSPNVRERSWLVILILSAMMLQCHDWQYLCLEPRTQSCTSLIFTNIKAQDLSLKNIKSLRRRVKERSVMAILVSILSRVAFPPPVTCLLVRVMSVAFLLFSVTGVFEGLGKNFQYSKFFNLNVHKSTSKQIRLSSRISMLIVYTPAFLYAIASFWQLPNVGLRSLLVKPALTLHFFKRILEVLATYALCLSLILSCTRTSTTKCVLIIM